jgi:histidinol phosphatase-like enzyme
MVFTSTGFYTAPITLQGTVAVLALTGEDRKPRPGMAMAAAATLNLDLIASWVVGDRAEDIGFAKAVGASAIYVGPGNCEPPAAWSFPGLAVAASFILKCVAA